MRRLWSILLLGIPAVASAELGDPLSYLWYMQNSYHWVSFKPKLPVNPPPGLPESVGGRLLLPAVTPAPAVLVLHGSSGVDSRGARYAESLRRVGFVTLEADVWQAMGVPPANRPRTVHETMPTVWGALQYLASRPEVDAQRIGVLGFSWGGVQALLAAREPAGSEPRFSAYAAMYPVCWGYNRVPGYELTAVNGPLQIGIGDRDDYDEGPGPCQALGERLKQGGSTVKVNVYRNSTHGFDRLEPKTSVIDPYSHLGAGGSVLLEPNYYAGVVSMRDTLDFFRRELKP